MREETFYQDLMSRILGNDRFLYSKVLKENDKELLEDYSSQLFNGIDSECKAIKAMFGLIKSLYSYRYENSPYSIPNDAYNRIPTYKKQSAKTKADNIRAKADKATGTIEKIMKPILDLMGGETLHTHKSEQLKRHYAELIKCLRNAEKDPLEYIPTISKEKNDKKAIESYLYSLKLQGKSNVIKTFIASIN